MNARRIVISAMIVSLSLIAAAATAQSESEGTVKWVCSQHPKRVKALFAALDLDSTGLEAVKAAAEQGKTVEACRALLDHYRSAAPQRGGQTPPKPGTGKSEGAEKLLNDIFTNQNVPGKLPRRPDGGWQWAHNGPHEDREWGWFVNRHGHLGTLYRAYRRTGNPAYAQRLDEHLRDWVISSPYPGKKSSTPQWRGLEASIRIQVWIPIFYGMMDDPLMKDSTRLLMLSSVPDHAHYLRNYHAGGGNWIANEMEGLSKLAMAWPELRGREGWMAYAIKNMSGEIDKQVYPDGAQKELTSHYHGVTVRHFDHFCETLRKAGATPSKDMVERVESMWNYLAYTMRPDGHGALNNDSNLDNNRGTIVKESKIFNRPDWLYIATNGKEGKEPDTPPSRMFPWAGHLVSRNGWDADAHWSFFDVGPYGLGHQHRDKLHLSVSAYGRDLLVDAGRYYYRRDKWRGFFVGSRSHNVILIDGKQQNAYEKVVDEPLAEDTWRIEPTLDQARGTFDGGYAGLSGIASHTRTVVYVRGRYWVVIDRVDTDRPRTIQGLWHYHPDCTVALEGLTAASTDADLGNLRVVPSEAISWKAEIVKGREEPVIQGWYSREYNSKTPAPAVIYEAKIPGSVTFAWLLTVARGPAPQGMIRVEHTSNQGTSLYLQVGNETIRMIVPYSTPPKSPSAK